MAGAIRSRSTGHSGSGYVSSPAGSTTGDTLVLIKMCTATGPGFSLVTPSGWTPQQVITSFNSGLTKVGVYTRGWVSGNISIETNGADFAYCELFAITDVNPNSMLIWDASDETGTNRNISISGLPSLAANSVWLSYCVQDCYYEGFPYSGYPASGVPSGMTSYAGGPAWADSTSDAAYMMVSLAVATQQNTPGGATATKTWSNLGGTYAGKSLMGFFSIPSATVVAPQRKGWGAVKIGA